MAGRKYGLFRVLVAFITLLLAQGLMMVADVQHVSAMTGTVNSAPAGRIRPFIDTWNGIHLFQPFDYDISDPARGALRYDSVWGASKYNIAAWRQGNPHIFLTYYIPFHRDGGTFGNLAAHHDLRWWQAHHPDWVLYKCDRKTPAYAYGDAGVVPLDFSNPAFISWQVQNYAQPASSAGYDGIGADNVDLANGYGACGIYRKGSWVQLYTGRVTDAMWNKNVLSWLSRMQRALHALPRPLALIPNVSFGSSLADTPLLQQFVTHVDGIGEEDGFTNQGRGYVTDSAWVQHMRIIAYVQAQGKPYYVTNQFSSVVGRQQIQWALASYLMGKFHTEALFISKYQQYGGELWYQEYAAHIGYPTGQMYQRQQVYWRSYSRGLVIVNPSSARTYTVTFPAGRRYIDLYSHAVGRTITLPAHTGMVLLNAS